MHLRKAICLILMALLLAQPVFAETEAATEAAPKPDIVTAVRNMETIPRDFGIHAAHTEELLWLRSLTASPLYAMTDGSWEPVLARSLPEDVTADYAGTYGIPANARRGYAFRILLNADACWENSRSITSDDYLYSIRELFTQEDSEADWLFLANAAAIAGIVLNIKPLLKGNENGKIVSFGKVRGRKKIIQLLAEKYDALVVEPEKQTIGMSHADCPEDAQLLIDLINRNKPPKEILLVDHEPATGSYLGPGALAIYFLGDKDVRTK